ncbi:MAG: hypothetical protein ABF545_00540 [Bifidobacterium psychraerophilum]|jgi:hypothetical protein|uniref:hypothetical protein n=1 Tax=Bifidobacterium psychraerophilum TaxID=218140 RepID=UPI0023550E25|nr:hypothetical protein [Bifidobacterium crudilactis]
MPRNNEGQFIGSAPDGSITRNDLSAMSAKEIDHARTHHQLDRLMGVSEPPTPPDEDAIQERISQARAQMRHMSPQEIDQARRDGRFDAALGKETR